MVCQLPAVWVGNEDVNFSEHVAAKVEAIFLIYILNLLKSGGVAFDAEVFLCSLTACC